MAGNRTKSAASAPIEISPEIRRAFTLPARAYSNPDLYELQKDRVFARSWQYAGDAGRVKAPGHVLPFTLLDGCLDEPLVLASDDSATVRCLSNVCTHRGALVVEGEGHLRSLRCRYHGRRFAMDGSFVSMPEFDGAEGFPSPADNLPRLPLEKWGPLLFTGITPSVPFSEWIAPVEHRVGWMPFDEFRRDQATSRDYLIHANWALYCDNYLEGFHIPYVHAGLAGALDYGSYTTELYPWSCLQLGVASDGEAALEPPAASPDHGRRIAAYYWWLYPNTMLNFYPWGVSVNVVKPLAADRTRVSYLSYVWDPSRLERGAGAALDRVEREDEVIVEAVQRGVRSRLYQRGRYSPRRERGVHHFHRLLAGALGGA